MISPLPPLPLIEGALFVSSTFFDTLPCPKEGEYYKLRARVSSSDSAGLTFGTHLHTALAMWYRLSEYDLSKEDRLSRCTDLLRDEFTMSPSPEGDWRNLNWACEVLSRYVAKYGDWDYEVMRWEKDQPCKKCNGTSKKTTQGIIFDNIPCPWCYGTGFTRIMSEVPFVVKLMDWVFDTGFPENIIPIYFHGFIDLLVRRNGLVFPLDFKTAFELGDRYWNERRSHPQLRRYAWALKQLLNLDCWGHIIHAIRTAQPPKYVVEGKPKKNGGEYKDITTWWNENITDQRFDFGEGELDETIRDDKANLETWLWHYARGYFPRQRTQCVRKGWSCPYLPCCSTYPESDREMLLASQLYEDKEQAQELLTHT
jgi:ATP-dependent exoDNAse (exonuclease V) beta subunit (contains helicase and exonuclease domains)